MALTQVKRLFKVLIFVTCKQNIIIFPDEISAVSVTSFDSYRPSKWQKVNKFGLCGNLETLRQGVGSNFWLGGEN